MPLVVAFAFIVLPFFLPPLCLWFLSESLPTDDVSNFDVIPAIIGLQGFFPLKGQAAMGIGSMEAPASERRRLAKLYVGRTSIQQFLLPFFYCEGIMTIFD